MAKAKATVQLALNIAINKNSNFRQFSIGQKKFIRGEDIGGDLLNITNTIFI